MISKHHFNVFLMNRLKLFEMVANVNKMNIKIYSIGMNNLVVMI